VIIDYRGTFLHLIKDTIAIDLYRRGLSVRIYNLIVLGVDSKGSARRANLPANQISIEFPIVFAKEPTQFGLFPTMKLFWKSAGWMNRYND
jgi:hypothetical protein